MWNCQHFVLFMARGLVYDYFMARQRKKLRKAAQYEQKQAGWMIGGIVVAGLALGAYMQTHRDEPAPVKPQKLSRAVAAAKKTAPAKPVEPVKSVEPVNTVETEEPLETVNAVETEEIEETVETVETVSEQPKQVEVQKDAAPDMQALRQKWMARSNDVYSVFEAVRAGNAEVLAARVSEGESVNVKNEQGATPLHIAAAEGNVEMVEALLSAGADPLARDKSDKIPSEVASNDAARKACEAGEAPRRREIEVAAAIRKGLDDEVRQAISDGVNPNALTEDSSNSLLTEAVSADRIEIVRLLLRAGADVNHRQQPNNRSVLNVAAAKGNVDMIKLLLAAGADPMAHTNHHAYPIHDAIWAGKTAAAIELIPCYKGVNFSPDGKGNGYPIGMAIGRGNREVVKAFLDAGIKQDAPMFRKEPLLVIAAKSNRPEMVRLLLQAGADVRQKDAAGKTAADYAQGEVSNILSAHK